MPAPDSAACCDVKPASTSKSDPFCWVTPKPGLYISAPLICQNQEQSQSPGVS